MRDLFFLSDYEVQRILAATGSARSIAETVGVSAPTVAKVKRLETDTARRVHAQMALVGIPADLWSPAKPKAGSLAPETVEYIRTSPKSSRELSEEIGCSASMIRMIKTGRSYLG